MNSSRADPYGNTSTCLLGMTIGVSPAAICRSAALFNVFRFGSALNRYSVRPNFDYTTRHECGTLHRPPGCEERSASPLCDPRGRPARTHRRGCRSIAGDDASEGNRSLCNLHFIYGIACNLVDALRIWRLGPASHHCVDPSPGAPRRRWLRRVDRPAGLPDNPLQFRADRRCPVLDGHGSIPQLGNLWNSGPIHDQFFRPPNGAPQTQSL